MRHSPGGERAIRSVAWDAAGSCLAATTSGLSFWNGTNWADVTLPSDVAERVRSVHHVSPGHWLVGGERGLFAYYISLEGMQRLRRPRTAATFESVSGNPDDIAVAVGALDEGAPMLFGMSGKRWLRELPVPNATSLMGLSRFGEEHWIVVGRKREGGAFAGLSTDAVVGESYWDVESSFLIEIGPIDYAVFVSFMPNGGNLRRLASLTRLYVNPEMGFRIELCLQRDELPPLRLDPEDPVGPLLGWNTWLSHYPMPHDPRDATYRL